MTRICKMGKSDRLADQIQLKIRDLVHGYMEKVYEYTAKTDSTMEDGDTETPIAFLTFFRDVWINFCLKMQTFRDVFLYLERTYLVKVR